MSVVGLLSVFSWGVEATQGSQRKRGSTGYSKRGAKQDRDKKKNRNNARPVYPTVGDRSLRGQAQKRLGNQNPSGGGPSPRADSQAMQSQPARRGEGKPEGANDRVAKGRENWQKNCYGCGVRLCQGGPQRQRGKWGKKKTKHNGLF